MSAPLRLAPASRPLRVLDVIHTLDPAHGGPAEGLRQTSAALQRLGHAPEVVSLDRAAEPWLRNVPVPVHALGPRWGRFGYARRLLPWLQEHAGRYDAVVVHGLWQYHGQAVRRALHGGRVPYFVVPHGMLDPWFGQAHPVRHLKKRLYWRWAEAQVLGDAAGVLFTSADEAQRAPQSFGPVGSVPLLVGHGVALDDTAANAEPADFLHRWPALRGRRLLLFLGRLHPKKGCDLLIDAFATHAAQAAPGSSLHLVMAGPGEPAFVQALQAQARRRGVEARITWTGLLQGREKWGALRAAEAFVLPSHQENFGIAVAEALAAGTPVLLSHAVNTWRPVVDAGAGLAEPDTAAGTAALIGRWLALPDEARQAMRHAAQRCFESHFHVDAAAHALARALANAPCRTAPNSQR